MTTTTTPAAPLESAAQSAARTRSVQADCGTIRRIIADAVDAFADGRYRNARYGLSIAQRLQQRARRDLTAPVVGGYTTRPATAAQVALRNELDALRVEIDDARTPIYRLDRQYEAATGYDDGAPDPWTIADAPASTAPQPEHVEFYGWRWFDGTNTYHSACVVVDGVVIFREPYAYGYGYQYETTCLAGYLAWRGEVADTMAPRTFFDARGVDFTSTVYDVKRKREMTLHVPYAD